jgi:hypothetical protein
MAPSDITDNGRRLTRNLLIVTALFEAPTGLAFLAAPSLVVWLLLGVALDAPGGLRVAQVTGTALLSIALACWLARDDGRSAAGRGIVTAALLYNLSIVALLAYTDIGLNMTGIGLWPAVGAHTALGAWCVACLRRVAAQGRTDRPSS